jgi:uncharacterized membrane protein (Fun14 family)
MEGRILKLEYEVSTAQIRKIWFDYFKQGLPNVAAFWGTGLVICLIALYFMSSKLFPFLMLFVIAAILISLIVMNYQSYIKISKQNFANLSESERIVQLTFQQGADGFDCVNGKSFGHISWESIKEVTEFDDYFVFGRAGNMFYVPKTAFRNESEINFLRILLSAHLGQNVKLLD